MKRLRSVLYLCTGLLVLLAACAPATQPVDSSGAAAPNGGGAAAVSTETLVPVSLSGPEMKVGSTFTYVDGATLVAVPAGAFTMGNGGEDNPEHQVTLSDFWIYSTEVTDQQFSLCVQAGVCAPPDALDNHGYADAARLNDPVTGVTYDQAAAYCGFVHARLPTEAEWEKAARGPDANLYPWGDASPSCDLLNYDNCLGKAANVTSYPQGASYYSALDMEGNAFEWTSDWYKADYYLNSPAEDPLGPDSGQQRSVRASGFDSGANQTPAASRFFAAPDAHRANLGFRCVVEDPTYFAAACQQIALVGTEPGGDSGGSLAKAPLICTLDSIDVQPGKCGTNSTLVTFESTGRVLLTEVGGMGGCTLVSGGNGSFPETYECNTPTTATIEGYCYSTLSGGIPLYCPEHYQYDSTIRTCVWDGTGGLGEACLPGQTYDPVNQCCTAAPTGGGSGTGDRYCPPGSWVAKVGPDEFVCMYNPDPPTVPVKSVNVTLPPACGGGGGGCQPPAGGCGTDSFGQPIQWDPKSCSCAG